MSDNFVTTSSPYQVGQSGIDNLLSYLHVSIFIHLHSAFNYIFKKNIPQINRFDFLTENPIGICIKNLCKSCLLLFPGLVTHPEGFKMTPFIYLLQ